MFGTEFSPRHRSLLKAVSEGRAQLLGAGTHAALCVDGLWCDQAAVSEVLSAGFVAAGRLSAVNSLVPAVLTAAGAAKLAGAALRTAA